MHKAGRLDVVWATDENYVFLTGVSMVSLFENNKFFEQIVVWILDDHISDKSRERLAECAQKYNRDIQFLDMEEYILKIKRIGAMKWGTGGSYSTYSRMFLADLMHQYGVSKVIYCDCDLIIDGPLQEIWNFPLGGGTLGMVKEYNRVEIRDLLGLSRKDSYYQAGLLLIDIEAWIKRKCTQKLLWHMKHVSAVYPFVDQDLINCVLHDEICTLPIQYNVNPRAMQFSYKQLTYIYGLNEDNYYTKNEFQNGLRNGRRPVVYHCSDPCGGRPWQAGNYNVFAKHWDYYFKKSSWYKTYVKEKYDPGSIEKIQYWLYSHLPKSIYAIILKYSARWAMVKTVKKYRMYQKHR